MVAHSSQSSLPCLNIEGLGSNLAVTKSSFPTKTTLIYLQNIIIMASAAPPSACQRLFRIKRRSSNDTKDKQVTKKCCRLIPSMCPSVKSRDETSGQNIMPTASAAFELILKENIFKTPFSKFSRPILNNRSLQFPCLDYEDQDASPEVATCHVDRHEIPNAMLCTEQDKEDAAKKAPLPRPHVVTPMLDCDTDDDENGPCSARANLLKRFEKAMDCP
jgi:hypothetical protein